jgi:acetylglutamate kinase
MFNSSGTTISDIVSLQKQGKPLVIVHGGQNLVTKWLKKQGAITTFSQGERITDGVTLEVVTAVLAGLVNKEIVAAIITAGGQAVGISGVDGALIQGKIKDKKMGYTGTVVRVDRALLTALLESGFIPVVAPISLHSFDKPDRAPLLLNINGDTVAGEIAAAISAEKLIFLTDIDGICDESGKLLPHLSPSEARALLDSGVATGGMIPKIKACLKAMSNNALTACAIIDGRQQHALLREIEEGDSGTTIQKVYQGKEGKD